MAALWPQGATAQQSTEVERVRLQSGDVVLDVTPALGGRVLRFGLADRPSLIKVGDPVASQPAPAVSPDADDIGYLGHDVWLGPQSGWWSDQHVNPARRASKAVWPPDPYLAFAETRDRLLAEPLPDSRQPEMMSLRERMRLSTVAERSPDIQFAFAQNVTAGGRVGSTLAGHGTPWEYDRRVPILFWWPGATGEERFLPIRTIDIAPTLAHVIGVATPKVEGRCIDLNGFAVADCPATETTPAR